MIIIPPYFGVPLKEIRREDFRIDHVMYQGKGQWRVSLTTKSGKLRVVVYQCPESEEPLMQRLLEVLPISYTSHFKKSLLIVQKNLLIASEDK